MRTTRNLFAAAVLLAGCSPAGSDDDERLGVIQTLPEQPAQVTVPATAQRGQPFEVTVVTHAAGCSSQGSTRVRTRGTTTEVRPYDFVGANTCPYVGRYEHTATLRVDQRGPATVRFVGTSYPGPETVTIDRTVTIQ